jgi:hypothetical protein
MRVDGKWYCLKHKLVLEDKNQRLRHWRQDHQGTDAGGRIHKNGQFKKVFATKTLRSMRDRARKVFSEDEYERLV